MLLNIDVNKTGHLSRLCFVEYEPLMGRANQARTHTDFRSHTQSIDYKYSQPKCLCLPVEFASTIRRAFSFSANEFTVLPNIIALHLIAVYFAMDGVEGVFQDRMIGIA